MNAEAQKKLNQAEKKYGTFSKRKKVVFEKWKELGNLYQEAASLLSFTGSNFQEAQEKVIECYSKAANATQNKSESMPLFARLGFLLFVSLERKSPDELVEECPLNGVFHLFQKTSVGKVFGFYLQASLQALDIAEFYEVQNQLKTSALHYGMAGDFYFSQYSALELLPEQHLFNDEDDTLNTLFKAAECYYKAIELSRKHGIPTINYWVRQSDYNAVFGDFFEASDKPQKTFLDDKQKAKIIYKHLEGTKGKYKIIAVKRLEALDALEEISAIKGDVARFEARMRDFIDYCLPSDEWLEKNTKLHQKICQRKNVELHFRRTTSRTVDFLDFEDYSTVILKHWDSTFKPHFLGTDQHAVKTRLNQMSHTYRNSDAHSRTTSNEERGLFVINARWFYQFFDPIEAQSSKQ